MILALFQAKPGRAGWERDKKISFQVPFLPNLGLSIPKKIV